MFKESSTFCQNLLLSEKQKRWKKIKDEISKLSYTRKKLISKVWHLLGDSSPTVVSTSNLFQWAVNHKLNCKPRNQAIACFSAEPLRLSQCCWDSVYKCRLISANHWHLAFRCLTLTVSCSCALLWQLAFLCCQILKYGNIKWLWIQIKCFQFQ